MPGNGWEMLNGIPRMIPVFETRHQMIALKIASALLLHVESRKLGHVLQAPCNVILSREFVIQPDILFVERRRSGLIEKRNFRGSPDLIAEIRSRDTCANDLDLKRKIYSRFAVQEFWVVDPHLETIEVLLWSELGYATAGIYAKSDRLISPGLPGFRLPLRRVFNGCF
jgi:Uma2 family endonuclease